MQQILVLKISNTTATNKKEKKSFRSKELLTPSLRPRFSCAPDSQNATAPEVCPRKLTDVADDVAIAA